MDDLFGDDDEKQEELTQATTPKDVEIFDTLNQKTHHFAKLLRERIKPGAMKNDKYIYVFGGLVTSYYGPIERLELGSSHNQFQAIPVPDPSNICGSDFISFVHKNEFMIVGGA